MNATKTKASKVGPLTTGSRVFYPSHGVASVTGREERKLGGQTHVFLRFELDRGGTLFVPLNKVEQVGVRALVTANKARELLKKVKLAPEAEAKMDHASRKKRDALYAEGLRSGSPDRYTEILRDLLYRSRKDRLTSSEQHTMDLVRAFFVGEVCAALNLSLEEVEADLRAVSGD
jgi:RNA polymerase-interacting CarD/CdnL/TRCF family regulator